MRIRGARVVLEPIEHGDLRGSFAVLHGGGEVGRIAYDAADERGRRELELRLAGGSEDARGVGRAALETLCDWLNRERGATEFGAQPSAHDPRAVAAFRAAGFRPPDLPNAGPDLTLLLRHPGRLRPSRDGDAPFLREMLYEAATWAPGSRQPALDEALAHPDLAKLIDGFGARRGDAGLVLEDEREGHLGAAWFRLWTAQSHSYGFVDEDTPELVIATLPSRRGQGVGGLLLRGLVQEAGRRGFARISLSVAHGNRARHLYERTGFREVADDGGAATLLLELAS